MKRRLVLVLLCLCVPPAARAAAPASASVASEVPADMFVIDLADPAIRADLGRQGAVVVEDGPGGAPAVRFAVAPEAAGRSATIGFPFDVAAFRGAQVALVAKVRGEDIRAADPARPLRSYHGGKLQIALSSPSAGDRWLDTRALHGTFGWRDASVLGSVDADAALGSVRIGLEQAAGVLWLSDIRLRVLRTRPVRPEPAPAVRDAVAAARVTRRGVMSPHRFSEKDFDDLAAWNVNVIRWQMYQQRDDATPYDRWIAAKLDDLAPALDAAAARGMTLAVDLHTPPGDRAPDRTHRMYLEKRHADEFVALWEQIARRFRGHPGLWAYNLVNEPVQNTPSPPGLDDWLALQLRAARAIRDIDPDTPIMIETDQWASPEGFAWLSPADVPGIIYQAHMYWPSEYTHQGVVTDQGVAAGRGTEEHPVSYPGVLRSGAVFDKAALRAHLAPVREFQLATGAPIFIGEFSAIRWAPGADRYLEDLISIFEEYGWDWTYHAFREWPGWSVEHAESPRDRSNHPVAEKPTDRLLVLQKWFTRNHRAGAK